MSGLKNWMRCLSFVVVAFLISGCAGSHIFTDSLLVDKSEITKISKLGIRFAFVTPEGVDPKSPWGMAKDLMDAGYFTGQFSSSYVASAANRFRQRGIELVNGGIYMPVPEIGLSNRLAWAGNSSHLLEIVPTSFEYFSSTDKKSGKTVSSTTMKAEMRLYDLKQKRMVWKAKNLIGISGKNSFDGGIGDQGANGADLAMLSLDEKGFITLSDENKAQIYDKNKGYFEFVKDQGYLEYVDSKRRAQ